MTFSALKRFLGKNPESDAVARAYARCFNTDDGKKVLEHLHQHSLFRITDSMTTDDHLRFIEGQRQMLLFMCQMIAKGSSPSTLSSPQTETPWKIS